MVAVMNLAIRGIEAIIGPRHADTFRRDLLANPLFDDSDTALRASGYLHREAKPQVMRSKAKDTFRKCDDHV